MSREARIGWPPLCKWWLAAPRLALPEPAPPVGFRTVTLGDLSGSESLLLLVRADELTGLVETAFSVRCAVLLLSILSLFDSIEVKLVLFILKLWLTVSG